MILLWTEALLATVRANPPATGPTVTARALGVLHTATYDAWEAYDPTAKSTLPNGIPEPQASSNPAADKVRDQFTDPAAYDEWAVRWRQRIADEPQSATERQAAMRSVNPAFIPRNHRVEAVIQAATNSDDYAPFEELLTVLSKPYEDQPSFAAYADPPMPEQRVLQTFCGT